MKNLTKKAKFMIMTAIAAIALCGCGSTDKGSSKDVTDDEAFYATQPVKSGVYEATYYDITGTEARKGNFDGRVLLALDPEKSGIYVYENGNRAKIDYGLTFDKPFEKGDKGIYRTVGDNGEPIEIYTDSTVYKLKFDRGKTSVTIDFNPKAMSTGSSYEIWERINRQLSEKRK